jgi:hypothetical protein
MADCSIPTMIAGSKCFDCFSTTEKLALQASFLADAVLALGGPDLTNRNVRRSTVRCFECFPDFRLDSMELLVAQRLASNGGAGAKVNLPIAQLRAKVSCGPCGDSLTTYHAQIMYLRCQLNRFIGTGAA